MKEMGLAVNTESRNLDDYGQALSPIFKKKQMEENYRKSRGKFSFISKFLNKCISYNKYNDCKFYIKYTFLRFILKSKNVHFFHSLL